MTNSWNDPPSFEPADQTPYGQQPPPGAEPYPPPPSGQPGYGAPGQYSQPGYGAPGQYGQASYGQPAGGYGAWGQPAPSGVPPQNYLVWAILSTLFCCLPLGIPAIVFASQVNSKWNAGDWAGADASAQKARQFSLWGTIIGALMIAGYMMLLVVGVAASAG